MNDTPLAAGLIAAAVLTIIAIAVRAHIARHWRAVLPRLPLPTLALAASYGVYSFSALFVPQWVAMVQAAAFELTYIGLSATTDFSPGQRRRAALVSVAAVVVSVIYNTLAGWFHRQPQLLETADPVPWLMLAILHGAPLAWVAYYVAQLLLHAEPHSVRAGTRGRARLVRGLVAALRESRATAAAMTEAAAQARDELAQVRAELLLLGDGGRAEIAMLRAELAQATAQVARAEDELARLADEHTQAAATAAQERAAWERQLREAEASARELDGQVRAARAAQARAESEVARLSEELARGGEFDVRELARWAAGLGAEGREIARKLGRSESTVRGWIKTRAVSAAD